LRDTEFNRCKSDLKFVEAAAYGAVALASKPVYGDTIDNGRTGLVFDTPDEFAGGLARLIEDGALRRDLADNAYRYVKAERLADTQAPLRAGWYRSLAERRTELTAALLRRTPEIGWWLGEKGGGA